MDTLNISVNKAKLLQQISSIDRLADNIAFMFSTILQVADEYPTWFSLDRLTDIKVLEDIYMEYDSKVSAISTQYEQDNNTADS